MIDRVFGSRYRIIERIGIGGMAEVYRATDQVLGRTVALKLMLPQYAADPTFAARFKQEAQAAANLQSPYIVNIYDWGRDDVDETFYIVMELVRGTDLKTAINQRGAINQRKAAEVASQVCAALAVAHGYDIIHRDIKPHNIMVQPDGNAKVMDFGIARANGSGMTQTGSVLGTAYYVSPEQAQGKELTPSTDLYSLGVVLYEAVTGKLPFEGEDAVTVALKQVNQLPAPPSTVYPDIDPELEAIIMRAIEKNPVDRYPTADAMRTALNNYLTGRPVEDGNVDAQAATTVIGATPTLRPEKRPERPVPEPVAIIQRPDTKVARTSVMPVATVGAPNGHNANALLQESRAKNRLPAIIVGIIAASLVIGFVVFLALNMLNSNTPDMVRVPNIIGMTEYDGERELTRNGLLVGEVNREPSDTVEKGKIISVDPRQNSLVYRGEKIDLLISSGTEAPVTKQVPNLANSDLDAAKQILEELGLKYSVEGEKYHESIEAGKVCEQSPAANQLVDEGSIIKLWVSKGIESAPIPYVIGESDGNAERILFDAGFIAVFASSKEYSDSVPKDHVIRQTPNASTIATKGSTVTLVISDGPSQVAVPVNLIGMNRDDATNTLASVGLFVKVETIETTSSDDVDKVLSCEPGVGTMVAKGSTITIYIGKQIVEPPPPIIPPGPGGNGP